MTLQELYDKLGDLLDFSEERKHLQVYLSESRSDLVIDEEGPTVISCISHMDHALVGEGWIIE